MKTRVLWMILLMAISGFVLPGASLLKEEQRTALVIGNSSYKSSPLRNPVNDATDIAEELRKVGFTVIQKKNATQREMERAIRKFGKELRKRGGVGLFYYAGHGIQVNGRNYLIPVDAEIETESDVKFEAVDAGRILGKMEDADNDLNIVILDACRDNPFARSFRSSTQGLARMDAPRGSIIAYSTAPGSVAADGKGRNGIFTKYFLKHMDTPGLPIEEVLKKVRVDVIYETHEKQIPWEASSLTGQFYFASKRGIVVKKRLKQAQPQEVDQGLEKEQRRLERERRDLERLRTEIEGKKLEAERKKLEAEKKRLEMTSLPKKASHSRPSFSSNIDERDGIYVAYTSGVVKDTNTGLEWKVGPDRDTRWSEARTWVESLNRNGSGWRMPTSVELRTLYKKGAGSRNMTHLLKTTGWWVWSAETKDTWLGEHAAMNFRFKTGSTAWGDRDLSFSFGRAFAVRSGK